MAENRFYQTSGKHKVFGRKQGRPLTPKRQRLMDELLPQIKPNLNLSKAEQIDPASLFAKDVSKTIVEVGFGDGERLADLHEKDDIANTGFIGCEPFVTGVSTLLDRIRDRNLDNLRVWDDDALPFLDCLTSSSVDLIYVLNPDPWPKKRHHKRRIIREETLDLFARLLKPQATLFMSTDVDDLAEWMVTKASNHPEFEWTATSKHDWQTPPKDWLTTKYERKGAEAGRTQSYLIFRRV